MARIQDITDYKSRSVPITCGATLAEGLNSFYAGFDLLNKESAVKTRHLEEQPLTESLEDVRIEPEVSAATRLRTFLSSGCDTPNLSSMLKYKK